MPRKQAEAVYTPMKPGANPTDINEIKRMYEEGKNAKEISATLRIAESCVASFHPDNLARIAKEEAEKKAAAAALKSAKNKLQ